MKKSLVLTGMMGVGKSTIGRLLAKRLKVKFIDVDKTIEKVEKKSIKKYLKLMERNILENLRKK